MIARASTARRANPDGARSGRPASVSPTEGAPDTKPKTKDPPETAGAPETESIGQATMDDKRVIHLMLRAEGDGARGDALFSYAPGDKDYDKILRHLGGLSPGQ